MRKTSKVLILMLLIACFSAGSCCAADIVGINDLIEQSAVRDDAEVTVQGEAIGEALERGDHVWINLNDGTNAIGIWTTRDAAQQIRVYGDYKHRGDIVRVTGIFHRACTEHGGDVDIHCSNIQIVESGHIITEKVADTTVPAAAVLLVITLSLILAYIKFSPKRKR